VNVRQAAALPAPPTASQLIYQKHRCEQADKPGRYPEFGPAILVARISYGFGHVPKLGGV